MRNKYGKNKREAKNLTKRKRQSQVRATESVKEKEKRLEDQRKRQSVKRATESVEEKEQRLGDQRKRQSDKIATESVEEKEQRLKDKRKRQSVKRATESIEEKEQRLGYKRKRQSDKIASESVEEREKRLDRLRRNNSNTWRRNLIEKTSQNFICTSECRFKAKSTVTPVILDGKNPTFTSEQIIYLTLNDDTKSFDGNFYVCFSCKKMIKQGRIPSCNEYIHKFLIEKMPENFRTPEMQLNRLEAYLLKLIIPFIRIAHVPRSDQFKIKGQMITVEADVDLSMEKILPRPQELIPVVLKRKMEYSGSVMEEIISKNKITAYYNWFKDNNPLFKDIILSQDKLDEFINQSVETTDNVQLHTDDENNIPEVINPDFTAKEPDAQIKADDDTVLENFSGKTDKGTGISDLIAEAIITKESDPYATIILAPTDGQKFVNFQDVVHIEEKCFPHLFPHGTGGYLSTYQSHGVRYSNYRKQRMMGIDRRFVEDKVYMAFLLQIKEALDIKNSRVLFFRKSKTDKTKYNKASLKDVDKSSLERTDLGFRALKNIRGTAPYFEENKRKLFAMIRQLQAPDLFFTKSAHEINYTELLQSLMEKELKRPLNDEDIDDIMNMSNTQKYKLLRKYPVDVVYHLDARFREQIKVFEKADDILGKYKAVDYSYRIEFQQRGSAHIHCILWLEDEQGNSPPSVDSENTENDAKFIEYFDSIVTATKDHNNLQGLKDKVSSYQFHRHTFSCEKNRNSTLVIKKNEGHGRLDGNMEEEEITVPVCRHNFPKFPIPETTIIRKIIYSEENKDTIILAHNNLEKIKKYIIRQTNTEAKKKEFEKNTFDSFLINLGLTYDQYIHALRASVKHNTAILPKRHCSDVFINNFSIKILTEDPSNHDIQVILNKQEGIAAASYIAKYITKEESGQSNLLKAVEEQSARDGDSSDQKLKKLGKVLDDTREIGLHEMVYRLLGLSMCKSSRKHKFINTCPPSKRDGLLKPNIESLDDDESVFFPNIIEYYQKRASTPRMDNMCLAEFVADFEIYDRSNKSAEESDQIKDDDNFDIIDDAPLINDVDLILQDKLGKLKKRRKRAIIRYYTGRKNYENEEYIRILMLLFHPFRNEVLEVHENSNIIDKYRSNKNAVDQKQNEFDPYPSFIEELQNAMDSAQVDDENVPEDFRDEETTTAEELNDFMKKQSKIHDGSKIRLEELKTVNESINTLNIEQRKFLDELMDKNENQQYFIYLYGRAGTGKTYLLNTVIPALEFKFLKSGVDLEKPLVLVMAPTANAAKNLMYGDTIHGALHWFGNTDIESLDKQSDNASLANHLSQVKVVIIDEISMVGANFFHKIHQGLSRLLGKDPFGGLSVIATGDFGQLPPVLDTWVFNRATIRGRANFTARNLWKENMTMYELKQHVRSSGDDYFSKLQECIAKGICSLEVQKAMESRIIDCPTEYCNDLYRDGKQIMITTTHAIKDAFNEKLIQMLEGQEFILYANDKPTLKSNSIPTQEELVGVSEADLKQIPTKLVLKKNAPIKITKNINKKDKLTNGTFGYVVDVDEDNGIVWCKFKNDDVGAITRYQSKIKYTRDKTAVPIKRVKDTVKLTIKSHHTSKRFEFKREGHPLVLAYSITSHGSQGMTRDIVISDFPKGSVKHGQFFVMISRARSLSGVYLKSFDPAWIKCEEVVSKEIKRLETTGKYKFDKTYNYDDCFVDPKTNQPCTGDIRIGYININGILHSNHFQCLSHDKHLLSSTLLCVAETKINGDTSSDCIQLDGFNVTERLDRVDGNSSMGMIVYNKLGLNIINTITKQTSAWQCISCEISEGTTHFIYMHPRISISDFKDLLSYLTPMAKSSTCLSIMGDFNIRYEVGGEIPKRFSEMCDVLDVKNTFNSTTHNGGGQLDYVLIPKSFPFKFYASSYRNLYSDHNSISLRFTTVSDAINKHEHEIRQNATNQNKDRTSQNLNGPTEYPCQICAVGVCANSLRCSKCQKWLHKRCVQQTTRQKITRKLIQSFICKPCKSDTHQGKSKNGINNSKNKIHDPQFGDASLISNNPSAAYSAVGLKNQGNNCWLNCLIQILIHTRDFITINEDDDRWHQVLKRFLDSACNGSTNLDVETRIHTGVSFKKAFSEITQCPEFYYPHQQDLADAFDLLLTNSFHFTYFNFDFKNTFICEGCNFSYEGAPSMDHKIRLQVTQQRGIFNMQTCLDGFLHNLVGKRCPRDDCDSNLSTQHFNMTRPAHYLLIDLMFYEQVGDLIARNSYKQKLNSNCTPLQYIVIPGLESTYKYELEAVVEHQGTKLIDPSNHYLSFVKKRDTWYRISDQHVTVTTELSKQPYVSLYKLQQ